MFNKLLGIFSEDIGIDLGTANTLIWVKGKGIAIREPSAVARHKKTKAILAVGSAAKKMVGKTPIQIEAIRPLKDGVIADFDATASMLSYYIKRVHEKGGIIPSLPRPRVVIGIPSGVTEVERRAVADAAVTSGAREAILVEEPMAAAVGIGLPIEEPGGTFIVDMGGGTTEIALISLGGVVVGRSVRIAGDEMDEAIINYVKLKYSLFLGQPTAERVKMEIGSVNESKVDKKLREEKFAVVRGRDLETGLPKSVKLTSTEIREALYPVIQEIVVSIKNTLEEAPPELVSDILETGIYLTGGTSQLEGVDEIIKEVTKMPVIKAEDPLTSVVRGCGKLLEDKELLKKMKVTSGLK